jgi:hypothetical protein
MSWLSEADEARSASVTDNAVRSHDVQVSNLRGSDGAHHRDACVLVGTSEVVQRENILGACRWRGARQRQKEPVADVLRPRPYSVQSIRMRSKKAPSRVRGNSVQERIVFEVQKFLVDASRAGEAVHDGRHRR